MLPAKTHDKVGSQVERILGEFDRDAFFAISGNDLAELAVLATRFNNKWDDANEMRDWQNRLNGIVTAAKAIPL